METKKGKKSEEKSRGISAGLVILVCAIIAVSVYIFYFGQPDNFAGYTPLDSKGEARFIVGEPKPMFYEPQIMLGEPKPVLNEKGEPMKNEKGEPVLKADTLFNEKGEPQFKIEPMLNDKGEQILRAEPKLFRIDANNKLTKEELKKDEKGNYIEEEKDEAGNTVAIRSDKKYDMPASVVFNQAVVGHPVNIQGTVYKGGVTVCIVMTLLLTVLALSVERYFAINKAKGTGNLIKFVSNVKRKLEAGDIAGAQTLCSKQKGSVANVVSSGLTKYEQVQNATEDMSKEQKLLAIQKDIEEATALELPTMEQNLPVVAAISSLGTLFGLFGTVLGMIRSFAAMSNEGAPDSVALAAGISEALINTAFGIATGALAIISYSYYTGKIDNITYAIDETGFSIVQTYAEKHK